MKVQVPQPIQLTLDLPPPTTSTLILSVFLVNNGNVVLAYLAEGSLCTSYNKARTRGAKWPLEVRGTANI